MMLLFYVLCLQLIHTISVVDRDEPQSGHRFYFTLAPEASNNRHFTLWDIKGETEMMLSVLDVKEISFNVHSIHRSLDQEWFSDP